MTTQAFTSKMRHDSDVEFRNWGLELSDALSAVGLTQTADTGQIDWVTVSRPGGTNADAGYEIWEFGDALQATAPIFLKVYYGNGGISTSSPRLKIDVGTGSNGTGTVTGLFITAKLPGAYSANATSDTGYPTYICHTAGSLLVHHKVGISNNEGTFFIARTTNTSGAATGEGVFVNVSSGSTSDYEIRVVWTVADGEIYSSTANGWLTSTFGGATTLVNGTDTQVITCFTSLPEIRPTDLFCSILSNDSTANTTFTCNILGQTHTYLVLSDNASSPAKDTAGSTGQRWAVIYE